MGRKKQQVSSSAVAAETETESGKGKEKGMQKEKEKGREERKEKQKEKKEKEKGRGERKEKAKEKEKGGEEAKEGDAKGVGQRFFKVFFPEQSAEKLKIPPPFHQYLQGEPTGMVSLKSSSGNTWQLMLTSDPDGFCFTQGWQEFVRDHSLKHGHFLVFTYDGHSQFSVVVFCPLGVEDPAALVAHPCRDMVVKVEDDERGVGIVDAAGTSEVLALPPEEGNRTARKRVREMNDLMTDGPAAKKHSSVLKKAEKKKPEAIVATSKAASTILDIDKDASKSLLDEFSSCNKTRIRSKDLPRVGEYVLSKSRQPVVISQRRPVTEEEKKHTLKRAQEFKSKNPFTMQIMKESYVYVGFFLNLPCNFVRASLPQRNKKMTLWDPQGKSWEVHYVYYDDRSTAAISGGWSRFALGNNLEKFDVCVYELFKEDNIKVHIYRVVPEITPLLRSSNK